MKIGIIWDLDGTLLDTLQDLTDSTNYVMTQMGYPTHSIQAVRQFVGNGARRLLELAVPPGGDAQRAYALFQQYYPTHCRIKTAPYPGIPEALASLQDHPLAIVSNKPDPAVKILCAQYFPGILACGEHPGCPRKPAPNMVWHAMTTLGVDRCVYVGDSEVDVETAKNAGVPCLSVTWGFRDRKELEEAGGKHFCDCPESLNKILKEMIEIYGK